MRRLVALLWLWCTALEAQQDPAAAALAARDDLLLAQTRLQEAEGASDRVAALTQTVRAYEDGLIALREGLRQAAAAEAQVSGALAAQGEDVSRLLGVVMAMGQAAGPGMLLHPDGALETARAGMIAAEITPAMQAEVTRLRARLSELQRLREVQETASDTLVVGLTGAQDARAALSAAIADRVDLPRRFEADLAKIDLLVQSAGTLDAFAAGLSGALGARDGAIAPETPLSQLALPVQGTVLRGFGAADAAGIARPGWLIAARPGALVTAPSAATILFAGPLLDYGNVIILEPAPETMFILAGLGEVYGVPGRVVAQGDALGLLGGDVPTGDAKLTESAQLDADDATQTLYLEVRDGQSPADPAAWFAQD